MKNNNIQKKLIHVSFVTRFLYKKEIYALKGSQWPLKQGSTEASIPQRGMILFEEGLIIDNDFKLLCICLRLLSTY